MKIDAKLILNLKTDEAQAKLKSATRTSMRDTVVAIANDAIKLSPVLTGNNKRSIKFEVGPNGEIAKGELEGAVYSTSGYGGFLEVGTIHQSAQPYFRPALDMNLHKLPEGIKAELK